MDAGTALVSVSIIEKDKNGDVLLAWMFPSLDDESGSVLIQRSKLAEDSVKQQQIFSNYRNEWQYIYTNTLDSKLPKLNRITAFSVCLITKVFCPEKYLFLCRILWNLYSSSGSPLNVLDGYLSVVTTGSVDGGELGIFEDSNPKFELRKVYLASSIREVIRMFGLESILLWTALLMEKRVVVYSEDLNVLLRAIRAFPQLILHRQNWNILRPYVTLSEGELVGDLETAGVYVAGFTDPQIRTREDLYDLFVDINALTITIPEHAKADFVMGPYHKEIATFLVESSDDGDATDMDLLKGLNGRTKELLTKLQSLKVEQPDGGSYITLESLQKRKVGRLDRFLFNVASAEGLTSA
eukprot:TRINITY_DN4169_c0_g1_i1.p1 TRINITY_DN4169_c0_g1~~TRINITY_DN4169_c0_g1_i1.p1  ORF type:complete len:354 (-),score=60.75 TRINITY_DN4169_c0_g1_i1:44-1105(-)